MLVSIAISRDGMPEDLVRSRLGKKLFAAVLRHPWYVKYVQPIGQDVVRWQVLEEDGFWRVQCSSDDRRMLKIDISQPLKRIVAAHLFKHQSGQWLYVSSYGVE